MACFTTRACLGQSTSSMGMEALPAGPGSSENAGLRSGPGRGPYHLGGGSSAAAPVGNNRGDASHPCRPGNNAQRRAQRRSLANQIKKSGDQPTAGSDRTTFDHFGTISRSRSSVNRATPPNFPGHVHKPLPSSFQAGPLSNQPRRARLLARPKGIECFCVSCGTIPLTIFCRPHSAPPTAYTMGAIAIATRRGGGRGKGMGRSRPAMRPGDLLRICPWIEEAAIQNAGSRRGGCVGLFS